ncbi:GNAT family N-acetyltransferase [Bdellovibrio bacteriovorus]|uniref:GNAT family N-acetyltransferase n=1 Tax=Bdellovibrio bacteriovorus TaxID=959 RepID=UPI0035A6A427
MRSEGFEVYNSKNGSYYSFHPLSFERDFDIYCKWMDTPYVAEWWGLNKTRDEKARKLISELEDTHQELFIGCIDGKPVGYWEKYWLNEDVLSQYIKTSPYDQGLHFLIGEKEYLGRTHTSASIAAFTKMIFSDARTMNVIGEPDVRNIKVLRYAEANCFVQREIVDLPERRSAIMVCEREIFFAKFAKEDSYLYQPAKTTNARREASLSSGELFY